MVEICGVKYMEGTSKKSGKPYQAYSVHYTEDGKPYGYQGYTTGDAFITLEILEGRIPQVGDRMNLFYNKNGFLQSVEFLR